MFRVARSTPTLHESASVYKVTFRQFILQGVFILLYESGSTGNLSTPSGHITIFRRLIKPAICVWACLLHFDAILTRSLFPDSRAQNACMTYIMSRHAHSHDSTARVQVGTLSLSYPVRHYYTQTESSADCLLLMSRNVVSSDNPPERRKRRRLWFDAFWQTRRETAIQTSMMKENVDE